MDFLEVLARDNVGDNLEPEVLDQEILKMKEMFGDMVDQVMNNWVDEKMEVLNSNTYGAKDSSLNQRITESTPKSSKDHLVFENGSIFVLRSSKFSERSIN